MLLPSQWVKGWGNNDPPQPMQVERTAPAPLLPPHTGPQNCLRNLWEKPTSIMANVCESRGMTSLYAERPKMRSSRRRKPQRPRQTRLQREEVAAKQKVPGSKGAAVFMWSKDEEKSYLLRWHVYRGQVEDAWMEFKPTQRRYDGFGRVGFKTTSSIRVCQM